MNIFVTGASGFIGHAFIRKLEDTLKNNDNVFLLLRKNIEFKDSRFHCLNGTLEDIGKFSKIILDCEYLFHIAANATFGNKEDYESTNYQPTKKIVDILKRSKKLKDFIFISTIGAVDRHKSDKCLMPLTKESVPSPKSKYGESKLRSEQYIHKSKIPFTIIRPTWVYGKHMRNKSHINLFVSLAYKKNPITRINFPGKVSIIHVDDLAKSLVNCINNKNIIGKTYFAETESKSMGEIFSTIWKKVHKKNVMQIPMPTFKHIIGRMHQLLPVPICNLFIDYLYVIDDEYEKSLLKNVNPIRFINGIDDVISTNTLTSGYWIITGANSGIGLALARKLEKQKKNMILIDKNIDIISKEFKKHKIIKADLSQIEQIKDSVNQIHPYPIYCLVNNAGIGYRNPFHKLSMEEIKKIISVNIEAHLYITKLLLEKLRKEGSIIVNVASSIAYNPLPNMLMYSSTKAFISNWSESLTYELKGTNKVITFSPSGTNTNFQENAGVKKEKEGKGLLTPEFVAEKIISAVEKNKTVVILGFKTKVLLMFSTILPRKINILFWGKLFDKMR
jgi:short-subunit dehydrogenase